VTDRGDHLPSDAPSGTTLEALLPEVPAALRASITGNRRATVTAMTHDSRAVAPGHLFACVRGEHHDGHRFAAGAVRAGATALLVDHVLDVGRTVGQLVVADTRVAMGPVASGVYRNPSRTLRVVGVTGTNGKTTTCALLAAVLRAAGEPTSVIGTLSGPKTTPEAPELQARLAAARDGGNRAVVMEASSHALAMHRVDGTRFAAAVFTNLGADHLDLHGTPEEYFRAKARLFTPELTTVGVANTDDVHGRLLLDAAPIDMVGFSMADATDVVVAADHHELTWRGVRLVVGLGGRFNVANTLAAATTAEVLGIPADVIAAGLAGAAVVPGRFERVIPSVGDGAGIVAIVDYAHTPDGLEEVVRAARAVTAGRVIVVFGAGGDRDHAKRPQMGEAASRLADVVVVTSDNPRSEDPAAIISAVLSGIEDRSAVIVEPDRTAAIANAIGVARAGDVVVVAGKGHETTQTIGDQSLPFDDREVVRRFLDGVGS
jgi:UDP-N-acetylmuramoyl-L-alanyl-D-glutamate--2,6-diaminopimelate ligase